MEQKMADLPPDRLATDVSLQLGVQQNRSDWTVAQILRVLVRSWE